MCANAYAQVNTGSTGSDGALDLTGSSGSVVINMADHPSGVYNYTYVDIPSGVTLTYIPNANNSPVTWLVQSNVTIDVNGQVDVSGQGSPAYSLQGGAGGPGGYAGGTGANVATTPNSATGGQGPGGGLPNPNPSLTFATGPASYCNVFLIPLLGGSGGGGIYGVPTGGGGGGGGGAILIAASGQIVVNGWILANGAGSGSGGAIRLVASQLSGSGFIEARNPDGTPSGQIRVDSYVNTFTGYFSGVPSLGSQFVIIPVAGQLPQLTVTGVGGVSISGSPTGVLTTPDAVLSAQQNNPVPIVVTCSNLPLNTLITVSVKPANGPAISATGYNTSGTSDASTATTPIVMPRGGGLISALIGVMLPTFADDTLTNIMSHVASYYYQFPAAEVPSMLQGQATGGNFILSWPLSWPFSTQNCTLETTTNLADPNSWVTITNVPANVNLQNAVTTPVTGSRGFYRLMPSQYPPESH